MLVGSYFVWIPTLVFDLNKQNQVFTATLRLVLTSSQTSLSSFPRSLHPVCICRNKKSTEASSQQTTPKL